MYIRLEYSEDSGHFHFSALNEKGENKNGYITLTSKIHSHQAELFCDQMRSKFPGIDANIEKVSFARMKQEFLDFLSSEIKSMREAMVTVHSRRTQVYKSK